MLTAKIRAALYACDLVDNAESDEACTTAVKMLCRQHGVELSSNPSEQTIIDLVTGKKEAEEQAKRSEENARLEASQKRADEIQAMGELFGIEQKKIDAMRKQYRIEVEGDEA